MNPLRTIAVMLTILLCSHTFAALPDIDTELSSLAGKLAAEVKDQGKTKVAVVDFADLQGGSQGELGKYIAEELTVDLVMAKRDFAVLDRANLKRILAEHKLTSEGLVDPDNAKKLGQFAGVDALILGTIIPKGTNAVSLNAKIITTDTAEIVGAAKAEFRFDDTVQQLVSKPSTQNATSGLLQDDKPQVEKSLGDLRVELLSLKIVNGGEFLLSMNLVNLNTNKSIFVALNTDMMNTPHAVVRDGSGNEFYSGPYDRGVSGIPSVMYSQYGYQGEGFSKAVEIRPGDSISATVKFFSRTRRAAEPGTCSIQLEFLISHDFSNGFGRGTINNFVAKINAE